MTNGSSEYTTHHGCATLSGDTFVEPFSCPRPTQSLHAQIERRKANINSRSRDLRESGWRPTSPPPAILT
jgi:hypothetical protein